MKTTKCIKAVFAIAVLVAGPFTTAQGQSASDPHHPSNAEGVQPSSPSAQVPSRQSGMMTDMPMAQMMSMMAQGCMAMSGARSGTLDGSGMAMIDHIDGRIAFLQAELKITDEQAGAWAEVEKALRGNAQLQKEARSGISGAAPSQLTLEQRLGNQERLLSAQLEGTRAIKAALGHLYLALSKEQQKTADELIGAQLGLRPTTALPMGMMQPNGTMP